MKKQVYSNILEAIGNTPIIRLNSIGKELEPTIYVKLEFTNPGGSIKDRIAPFILNAAEKDGSLLPGATIVEATSGNTGMGLAMVAITRGYKLIAVISDKQSADKINTLKALGVKTIITPSEVEPDHPDSYYSVAKTIAKETPNSFLVNQYHNNDNPTAHYYGTGPEIWKQMGGEINYFVSGVGTGGTISGVSRYLKEQNKNIQSFGIDAKGSILREYHETKKIGVAHPYLTEGIGEDIIPENVHFKYIDKMITVNDKEAVTYLHRLAKEEGIFAGSSSGAAIAGAIKASKSLSKGNMLVILPDRGEKYLAKFYNPEWLKKNKLTD